MTPAVSRDAYGNSNFLTKSAGLCLPYMLSPSMMTRSKGKVPWTFVICCAIWYWGRSPVPLSPIAANFSESDLLGSDVDCAKSAVEATAAARRSIERERRTQKPCTETANLSIAGTHRVRCCARRCVWRKIGLPMKRLVGLISLICLVTGFPAFAQEPATRAEADRQRREEKSRSLQPYNPGRLERAMHFVEERAVFIVGREGLYPKLGSLTTGSGFAYGAGYRDRDLFNNTGTIDVWAATSLRRYWATEARLTFPKLANNRMLVETWAAHRDYPQEDFFGIGPDSVRDAQTSYAIRSDAFGARVGVRPVPIVLAGGGLEYLNPALGVGKDGRVPSIEQLFSPTAGTGPR